jgi:hypothetical protein
MLAEYFQKAQRVMRRRTQLLVAVGIAGCLGVGIGVMALAEEQPSAKSEPFRYDSKGLRDPFIPLVRDGRLVGTPTATQLEPSKPVLYGILWDSGGQCLALINDTEVKVGDMVGEYQVTEIRKDAVVLTAGGESMVLELQFEKPASELSPDATTGGEGP